MFPSQRLNSEPGIVCPPSRRLHAPSATRVDQHGVHHSAAHASGGEPHRVGRAPISAGATGVYVLSKVLPLIYNNAGCKTLISKRLVSASSLQCMSLLR